MSRLDAPSSAAAPAGVISSVPVPLGGSTSGAISSGETAPAMPPPPRAGTHAGRAADALVRDGEDLSCKTPVGLADGDGSGTLTTLAGPAEGDDDGDGSGTLTTLAGAADGDSAPSAVSPKAMASGAISASVGLDKLVRATGIAAVVGIAATVWLGLWVTPNAVNFGNLVRLLYIHPPLAWVMFVAYGVATASSLLYLWPRTRRQRFDRLAGASAEVGVVFTGLTLVTGSIWGRPTWGVWWTWDPLLTTTALLFVLYLGYLALRKVPGDRETVARRSAIAGLIAFLDVPIVFFSVSWWRSLHQAPTVDLANGHLYVHGSMAWTLLLGFVSFTLLYVWLMVHRYRLAVLRDREDDEGLEAALAERWAEGGP